MSKHIPTRNGNPCPVCADTSGKCRSKEDAGKEFFYCMSFADAKFGELANGFKCIHEASAEKSYFASTWVLNDSAEWTEEKRREWEQERELAQQRQAKEKEHEKRRSLSAKERHKNNLILLAQLSLHPQDRADLVRRGFTDEEIEKSGFKSVKQGQNYLSDRINPLLPGASGGDGKHIYSSADGYLCPVRDIDGRICGMQIRAREVQSGNKYPWLSTKQATLHLYPEGNKELPLAVHLPPSYSQGGAEGIALVEGTGAKPFLLSSRWGGLAVIGASGGQWLSSPQTLRGTLTYLKCYGLDNKSDRVELYPDAGDILNASVILRWEKLYRWLEEEGWKPTIRWWGQFTKDDFDIDELITLKTEDRPAIETIQSLSLDEFLKLKEDAEKAEQERLEYLKAEAEEARYRELTGITEKPWLEVNQKELDIDEHIKLGAIYIILSAKGTGKTKGLKHTVRRFNTIYAWFSRRALGNEECSRIGIDWDKKHLGFSKVIRVGFCADSAHKYDPAKLGKNALLLIDEADQVFDHMQGDTCNKDGKRPMIQAHLEAHIDAALAGDGAALFMSADITQRDIDYIKELAPSDVPVRLIVNHYKPEKGDCYFDESDTPDGQIEQLLGNLEEGIPTFVIDDIKNGIRGCKSIAEYIRTIHPEWADKIVEINSDTSGDTTVISFLENINKASEDVLLICCSPSVISGISLENGRFNDSVFGFFNGILTVSQASQALSRVRGATAVNVWAAEEGLVYAANHATDPREISSYYQRNYEQNSKYIQSFKPDYEPMIGEWTSPHWRLYCKNAAYRNLCMAKLRERLKAKLEDEGYYIIESQNSGSDMVKKALQEAWTKIELNEAEAVACAEFFTDEELEQIQYRNEGLKPEEKPRFEKTMLQKWFGEELIQATQFEHKESGRTFTGYAAMYLKNERGAYKQQLDNFYLLTAGIEEAIAQDYAREKRQLNHGFGRFASDVRWRGRQVKCREHLGLKQFLKPGEWTTPNDYQELVAKAKAKAGQIKDVLGISVDKIESNAQVFTALIEQLGLELDKQWAELPSDGSRKRFKKRRISEESWKFAQMYVSHKQSLKAEAEAKQAAYEASKVSEPVAVSKPVEQATYEAATEVVQSVQLELVQPVQPVSVSSADCTEEVAVVAIDDEAPEIMPSEIERRYLPELDMRLAGIAVKWREFVAQLGVLFYEYKNTIYYELKLGDRQEWVNQNYLWGTA